MKTSEFIISRLPDGPTVSPGDIQRAANLQTVSSVINAIQSGTLSAVKIGGRYVISREAAISYIQSAEREAIK